MEPRPSPRREWLWRVIFLSDTRAGKAFDIALLWLISLSVLVVMLESVDSIRLRHFRLLWGLEWFFTLVFTAEYAVRLWVVRNRRSYALGFFGIVDLISILPTYLELVISGSHYLMVVRILRLLRMFRVLKMAQHIDEAGVLLNALRSGRHKIAVFFMGILLLVCVEGTIVYLLEHPVNAGFANIPQSIYWAIVTITTVGYGDVAPVTVLGKVMASIVMLTGFAIIAVPTGIVTAEIGREMNVIRLDHRRCGECGTVGHRPQALFCALCGQKL